MQRKLGSKIGENRLSFPKSREGTEAAIDLVRKTLKNITESTGVISKSLVRGDFDLVHVYSSKTDNTVSLRVTSDGKYEFDTLIPGKSSKFKYEK